MWSWNISGLFVFFCLQNRGNYVKHTEKSSFVVKLHWSLTCSVTAIFYTVKLPQSITLGNTNYWNEMKPWQNCSVFFTLFDLISFCTVHKLIFTGWNPQNASKKPIDSPSTVYLYEDFGAVTCFHQILTMYNMYTRPSGSYLQPTSTMQWWYNGCRHFINAELYITRFFISSLHYVVMCNVLPANNLENAPFHPTK